MSKFIYDDGECRNKRMSDYDEPISLGVPIFLISFTIILFVVVGLLIYGAVFANWSNEVYRGPEGHCYDYHGPSVANDVNGPVEIKCFDNSGKFVCGYDPGRDSTTHWC